MIPQTKLDLWLKNNLNVLLEGAHGVGKTSILVETFKRHNLKWRYYSCSTLDPWVDFIGVPREKTNEKGETFLELIRPQEWMNDEIEIVFLDEYNRSHPKIRNAVMELIQFKSINGKKFKNLRMVWAAINPENTEDSEAKYDVEKIDPAQKDRFQVHYIVDNAPDKEYFVKNFGEANAIGAIEWWNNLPKEIKSLVSPRRLDYALDYYLNKGGDLRDVLSSKTNTSKLAQMIRADDLMKKINEAFYETDVEKLETLCRNIFDNPNHHDRAVPIIIEKDEYLPKFISFFPKETFSTLLVSGKKKFKDYVIKNPNVFSDILFEIIDANTNKQAVAFSKKILENKNITVTKPSEYKNVLNQSSFKKKEYFDKLGIINNPNLNYSEKAERIKDFLPYLSENVNTIALGDALKSFGEFVEKNNRYFFESDPRFFVVGDIVYSIVKKLKDQNFEFENISLKPHIVRAIKSKLNIEIPLKQEKDDMVSGGDENSPYKIIKEYGETAKVDEECPF